MIPPARASSTAMRWAKTKPSLTSSSARRSTILKIRSTSPYTNTLIRKRKWIQMLMNSSLRPRMTGPNTVLSISPAEKPVEGFVKPSPPRKFSSRSQNRLDLPLEKLLLRLPSLLILLLKVEASSLWFLRLKIVRLLHWNSVNRSVKTSPNLTRNQPKEVTILRERTWPNA